MRTATGRIAGPESPPVLLAGGFVHVPYLPEQTLDLPEGTPSMSAEMIEEALEYGIRAIIENEEDVKTTGGEIH